MIAALYVETDGAYFGLDGVEPWDEAKDARRYTGPHPVVAHPPCQRWGRYWHGAPRKPNEYRLGEDGGCFATALTAVRNYGGVLEHPAHSNAWRFFGLATPPKAGGWVKADEFGGWTCHVEQGHYGHMSRKATWLYAVGTERPELTWGPSEQRIHPVALAKHGYEKARRIGMVAMVGGKDKTRIRNATPPEFRDLLLAIARSANKASNAWDKSLGLGPADSFADAEFAWCSWRTKRNVARFMWKGVCGVKAGEDKERSHPTQKPICLMKWCLESAPDSVSTVADPFMGSGTTGVACANLGKTFYGIEREPKYFDIACQRIENAYRQERLFA